MYEVFINYNALVFDELSFEKKYKKGWQKYYSTDPSLNPTNIFMLMSDETYHKQVVILSGNPEKTKNNFFKNFKHIKAAGGLVINQKNEILFIFRNGKWDLPKGKTERKEKPKTAAIREVQEETGIDQLEIIEPLQKTCHCYLINNTPCLKETFWYLMKTNSTIKLVPQLEEGITRVEWIARSRLRRCLKNTYKLIENLVNTYISNMK